MVTNYELIFILIFVISYIRHLHNKIETLQKDSKVNDETYKFILDLSTLSSQIIYHYGSKRDKRLYDVMLAGWKDKLNIGNKIGDKNGL